MRVLQVNKFFWENAGPERYMLEISRLLQRRGHEVLFFAMDHERNLPSPHRRYFVSGIDYRNASPWYRLRTAARTVAKTVYSLESRRKMQALLKAARPDVAHLHGISRQISPSVLHALKDAGVPVVQTVHNAELLCPAAHLYIEHRGQVCQRCLGGKYYHAVLHRCLRRSVAASALVGAAQYIHRKSRIFERNVDLFVAPSRFLAGKLVDGGIPSTKIRHLPNFIDLAHYAPSADAGRYGLYLGRLSAEKGLVTLLDAAAKAPEVPLVIAGEGPQQEELRQRAREKELLNVRFAGYQRGEPLRDMLRHAAFVVLPSECFENSPMVIYEAGATGRPVLASRIGGIPELVVEGQTGLLFGPGSADELSRQMARLYGDQELCRRLGNGARRHIEHVCHDHLERLLAVYEEARGGIAPSSPTPGACCSEAHCELELCVEEDPTQVLNHLQ